MKAFIILFALIFSALLLIMSDLDSESTKRETDRLPVLTETEKPAPVENLIDTEQVASSSANNESKGEEVANPEAVLSREIIASSYDVTDMIKKRSFDNKEPKELQQYIWAFIKEDDVKKAVDIVKKLPDPSQIKYPKDFREWLNEDGKKLRFFLRAGYGCKRIPAIGEPELNKIEKIRKESLAEGDEFKLELDVFNELKQIVSMDYGKYAYPLARLVIIMFDESFVEDEDLMREMWGPTPDNIQDLYARAREYFYISSKLDPSYDNRYGERALKRIREAMENWED